MSVLYRGPRALITHEVIEVPQPEWHRFAIKDLAAVHIVQHGPDVNVARRRTFGLIALGSVFVTVPVIGPSSPIVAVVVMIGSLTYAGACLRSASGVGWTLVAAYRGRTVVLFESTSQREFYQVCRALLRALQQRQDSARYPEFPPTTE
jgi:Family of unknown function (DUF6232)